MSAIMDRNKIAYLRAFIKLRPMQVILWITKCTVSKKSVSSSLCQIKQFLSYFQWKVFLYLLLRKNTSNQQKLNCGLTLYFCNNYFRWNSWFVCLRWYRESVISPNCLDHSNKVTVVIFLATYFLFNTIKPRSGNKSICFNLSLLTMNTRATFLITY